MQEAIAQQIAALLKPNLTGADKQRLSLSPTENPAAYQLFLRGRYFWNKLTIEGIQKGLGFFKQAIEEDPRFALAYAGLVDCYTLQSMQV